MTDQPHADPTAVQRRASKVARDVTALLATVEELTAERDAARSLAAALEQECALKDEALGEMRHVSSEGNGDEMWCCDCGDTWPCTTERILDTLAARLSAHLLPTDEGEAQ